MFIPKCLAENENAFAALKAGDSVYWGKYEQDNNNSNGAEQLKWIVLAVEEHRVLLITEVGVDVIPYYTDPSDPTDFYGMQYTTMYWGKSTLRTWLNKDFLSSAFTSEEQKEILLTDLTTNDANGKTKTSDKVFLLSQEEAKKYFSSSKAMACKPSKYAKQKITMSGAIDSNGYGVWWLRDVSVLGDSKKSNVVNRIAVVCQQSGIKTDNIANFPYVWTGLMVRPAMWVTTGNEKQEGKSNSASSSIEQGTYDLSSMSYEELIELKERINLAIWQSETWQEVTVPQGVYTVGEDIPAGKWTIKPAESQKIYLSWCDKLKASGVEMSYEGDVHVFTAMESKSCSTYKEGDAEEVTYDLKEGQYIIIERGNAVFTPYAGKQDLGFSR